MDKHDFSQIFSVFSKDTECTAALKILAPAFPYYRDTAGIVDIKTLHRHGGTFLSNWNLCIREANCAINVLKELQENGHNCFFIVPIGSCDGFPDSVREEMYARYSFCMRLLNEPIAQQGGLPFPKYFSVHTYSRNQVCVDAYRETAIARVLEEIPDIAMHPEFVEGAEEFTTNYLKGFTLANDNDNKS